MQLYIIRHAQSENNALWSQTGSNNGRSPDPMLTEIGHRQAQLLAEYLAQPVSGEVSERWDGHNRQGYLLTHLYTSLMQRAVETGTYVANELDLPLVGREDIHERGGIFQDDEVTGERTGLPGAGRSYFASEYPDLILPDSMNDEGWWSRPYEPEELSIERARRFLRDLLAHHGDGEDRVGIISHGGFINSLLGVIFGATKPNIFAGDLKGVWFGTSNTAITRVDFRPDFVLLVYLNRVYFLPFELIT